MIKILQFVNVILFCINAHEADYDSCSECFALWTQLDYLKASFTVTLRIFTLCTFFYDLNIDKIMQCDLCPIFCTQTAKSI